MFRDKEILDSLIFKVRNEIQTQIDSENYEWFIENLAYELGLEVVVGDTNIIKHYNILRMAFAGAFEIAGRQYPEMRLKMMLMLMDTLQDMLNNLKDWVNEEDI